MRTLFKVLAAPIVFTAATTAIATGVGTAIGVLYVCNKKDVVIDKVDKVKEAAEKVKDVFKK